MNVYVVEQVYWIEDNYRAESVVKVCATTEGAEAWIARTLAEEAAMRAASVRYRALRAEAEAKIPLNFAEAHPRTNGLAREVAKAALAAYHEGFAEANEARARLVRASMAEVWVAEGQAIPLNEVKISFPGEPTVYTVTPMEVGD